MAAAKPPALLAALLLGLVMLPSVARGQERISSQVPSWPPPPAAERIRFLQELSRPGQLGLKSGGLGAALGKLLFGFREPEVLRPYGVAVSGRRIYLADPGAGTVHLFDLDSRRYVRLKGPRGQPLLSPIGVAVDPAGELYVSDSQAGRILVFDRRSRFLFSFGQELVRPTGIAWAQGRLYVADTASHRLLVYQRQADAARLLFQFGRRGSEPGAFNFPVDVAVSRAGRVYVNDSMNFRIQVFDLQGRYLYAVGSAGDSSGHFQRPKGVAVDSEENLYVVDALSDTVQIFDRRGRFLLNFGSPGQQRGQFWLPAGLAVDEANRIYVADSYNHRLQMFQYVGGSDRHDP